MIARDSPSPSESSAYMTRVVCPASAAGRIAVTTAASPTCSCAAATCSASGSGEPSDGAVSSSE